MLETAAVAFVFPLGGGASFSFLFMVVPIAFRRVRF
jgi:hypothetical protein